MLFTPFIHNYKAILEESELKTRVRRSSGCTQMHSANERSQIAATMPGTTSAS